MLPEYFFRLNPVSQLSPLKFNARRPPSNRPFTHNFKHGIVVLRISRLDTKSLFQGSMLVKHQHLRLTTRHRGLQHVNGGNVHKMLFKEGNNMQLHAAVGNMC
jgi:hypothetical protein